MNKTFFAEGFSVIEHVSFDEIIFEQQRKYACTHAHIKNQQITKQCRAQDACTQNIPKVKKRNCTLKVAARYDLMTTTFNPFTSEAGGRCQHTPRTAL